MKKNVSIIFSIMILLSILLTIYSSRSQNLNDLINYNDIINNSNSIEIIYNKKMSNKSSEKISYNKNLIKNCLESFNEYTYKLTVPKLFESSHKLFEDINNNEENFDNYAITIKDSQNNDIFRAFTKGARYIRILNKKNDFPIYTLNKDFNPKYIDKIFENIK